MQKQLPLQITQNKSLKAGQAKIISFQNILI